MNSENYARCGVRVAQGDIARAPVAAFIRWTAGPSRPTMPVFGDPTGIEVALEDPFGLKLRYLPALVVSPDCGIDKQPESILVAPIYPLEILDAPNRAGVEQGSFVAAMKLPGDENMEAEDGSEFPFPDSYVDLNGISAVDPDLVVAQRMFALSDDQIDRVQSAWLRYGVGRELSSTGTIDAARGKRVADGVTLESSKRRHTVQLVFEDESTLILYREPGRKADHVQIVEIAEAGEFHPSLVQAITASNLVLRFENDTRRDWNISCAALGLASTRLRSGETTPVLIRCPESPIEAIVLNLDKRSQTLQLRVVDGEQEGATGNGK